jgi:hypothetical protein
MPNRSLSGTAFDIDMPAMEAAAQSGSQFFRMLLPVRGLAGLYPVAIFRLSAKSAVLVFSSTSNIHY